MSGIDDLLTAPAVVVAQRGKFVSHRADYDLYRPDGTPLGTVAEEVSLGGVFARKLSTLRFAVTDTAGAVVATIEKPGSIGRSSFVVYDADDRPLGEVEQDNLMFAPQLTISTPAGVLRLTSPAMMAWEWQLSDPGGASVGSITRQFAGLADVLTSAECFVVTLSPALTGAQRLVSLAACLCLDVVRDLKGRGGSSTSM